MKEFRLSRGLCATIADSISGSHDDLNALFISAGAPGEPPELAHRLKWKEWLFRAGQDPETDSLKVLGNILEEYMDYEPTEGSATHQLWQSNKPRIEKALIDSGLEYYQGGRVIPNGTSILRSDLPDQPSATIGDSDGAIPSSIDKLLSVIVCGLPRAMYPLSHRRKGSEVLSFSNEYDVQDLLHAMLKPWVSDVRAEEYTPSYAGTATRMDFLLPAHSTVVETKYIRDTNHARKVGNELIVDIAHYQAHPKCEHLWCVLYDPSRFIKNVGGLVSDLEGSHSAGIRTVSVRVLVV